MKNIINIQFSHGHGNSNTCKSGLFLAGLQLHVWSQGHNTSKKHGEQ